MRSAGAVEEPATRGHRRIRRRVRRPYVLAHVAVGPRDDRRDSASSSSYAVRDQAARSAPRMSSRHTSTPLPSGSRTSSTATSGPPPDAPCGLARGRRLAHDLDVGLGLEQADEATPDDLVVVDDEHTDHPRTSSCSSRRAAERRAPPYRRITLGRRIDIAPPSASAREARFRSPLRRPVVGMPRPSSCTVIATSRSSTDTDRLRRPPRHAARRS